MLKKYNYTLKNLDCANCANKIQTKISSYPEYKNVVVNFSTLRLSFQTDMDQSKVKSAITKIVNSLEPEIEVLDNNEKSNIKKDYSIIRLLIGILIGIIGFSIDLPLHLSEVLVILSYIILLSRTAITAYKILKNSKSIDENFLVVISCIGAYLVGEHIEGLMVIILYEIGKILEEKAINNTRRSIKELMDIKPEYANLKVKEGLVKVSPEELKIDDIIVIKQGEKVPIDGIVIKGTAKINTAALTGESEETEVAESSTILSGSILTSGLVEVKVTCLYENSTVSKILELVENATDKKAKTETFVSKMAKIYTPVVIGLAIIVAITLPLFTNLTYSESFYRSLIFLVISCPCAIAISVPLSYFSGIGAASKRGILIKGSNYLDSLKDVKMIIFDKTGTITTGSFNVKEINTYDKKYSKKDILDLIAKGESFSNHPIAKSILKEIRYELDLTNVNNYEEVAGKGIKYMLKDKEVKIGNSDFVNYNDTTAIINTILYLSYDGKVIGNIVIDDGVKQEAISTIAKLKKMGIKVAMFTGDNNKVASAIAEKVGIDYVKADLLPVDKYSELENLINNNKQENYKIAFVGDGINDAPVIARSDIGFSMGNLGQSSAIEASDVVLMTDDLNRIVTSLKISEVTRQIIKQNLIFAISTKIIILLLSLFGLAGMWQAIFADVGVTLITILNTTRIIKTKKFY